MRWALLQGNYQTGTETMIIENLLIVNHKNDCRAIKIDSHSLSQPKIAPQSITTDERGRRAADFTARIVAEFIHSGRLTYALAVRARSGFKQVIFISHKIVRCPSRLRCVFESFTPYDSVHNASAFSRAILATRPELGKVAR